MSVTKIERINDLQRSVNYVTRNEKTESRFIYSHECTPETVARDFNYILDLYNESNGTNRELKPRMIYQSFSPNENITPEEAFQYGKEFAKNYLGEDYQYIVATHYDTNHIHNHIIFNDININNLRVFDSSRENTLHRMRNENDRISEKYGLHIIESVKHKHKYLSHKEYVARSKGNSFKDILENDIDEAIQLSNDFQSFLKNMEDKGYEYKQGKYLSFKSPKGKRFIRTKTLGFNYLENSIKHRIENKDYVPFKPNVINREWIDKNQEKFKENKYLRRWATVQNINYLNELYGVLKKKGISLSEFVTHENMNKNITKELDRRLSKLDGEIYDLSRMSDCFDVYKSSYGMIMEFKKLDTDEEKEQFKKDNYANFKKYDMAKKHINILKKIHGINNKAMLEKRINSLEKERRLIYESLNINVDRELKRNRERTSNKDLER